MKEWLQGWTRRDAALAVLLGAALHWFGALGLLLAVLATAGWLREHTEAPKRPTLRLVTKRERLADINRRLRRRAR